MKRIAALKPLSMDHHYGLVLARKARLAADGHAEEQQKIWAELHAHARNILEPHFVIEEEAIAATLSALNDPQINIMVQRLYDEHAALRQLLSTDQPQTAAHLKQLGALLEQHIRFEERELFETAQTKLDQPALEAIATACANHARHQ